MNRAADLASRHANAASKLRKGAGAVDDIVRMARDRDTSDAVITQIHYLGAIITQALAELDAPPEGGRPNLTVVTPARV